MPKKFFSWWIRPKKKVVIAKYPRTIHLKSFTDLPESLANAIYVVGDAENPKWVVFNCPDNCGHRVEVNLMRSRRPFWIVKIRRNKVSLRPSIVVNICQSHFWLEDNKIRWSYD